jgi:16S rRNA (uracil1498-N3)-methyltransferase
MPRFYLDSALRAGSSVSLPEDSAHHAVHVLRVHTGDEVTLFNGRGGEYAARIASIERLKVLVDVLAHRAIERESPLRVVLVQGVSAGERMDFTVRKSVELGVAEIQPVLAASSVARPKGERAAARQAHWQ